MVKAVIFDMDGVLIDSVELGHIRRKKILAQYNVDLDAVPDPQGEAHRAASLKSLLSSVENHYGIRIDYDEFARISREHMHEDFQTYEISSDPGLVAFLKELRQHDIICAIVSSGLREGVDIKLEVLGIKQYFSTIITGTDVKEHKPHPEPYLHALKKLDLAPSDCVIFEDSVTGVKAGQAAGCRVIGFTQYNPSKEPLPGVVATIKNWSEINYNTLERLLSDTSKTE
ncbi:MAG: haloacid dehalogenase [Candidatus Saccharibacteria bacterium]|nr:haloacid dehalogenase [Candidatus Saccharibacteria bacterium]